MITRHTERLILRPPQDDDAAVLAAMHQEPAVLKYVLGGVPPTGGVEMAWRNIAMLAGHWHLRGFGPWIVVEKASGDIIGRVGLWQPAGWPGCELNWLIRGAWTNRGLATEAAREALRFAWQQPRLDRIISLIQPDNAASIRVAEKIGETRAGEHVIAGTVLHEYRDRAAGVMPSIIERVDHLVYATPDLLASISNLEHRLGVRATAGGRHEGRGTKNALLSLGPRAYLEVVGPDPSQTPPPGGRWFGIDTLGHARLVAWAAHANNLDALAKTAANHEITLGTVSEGRRTRDDGVTLQWSFTDPTAVIEDGIVPFFIDWGASPHPATSAATGVTLIGIRAEHPHPQRVREALAALELDLDVATAPRPALIATLHTAMGDVELR